MTSGGGRADAPLSLAHRLDHLFRTVRTRDKETGELREYSLREVADAVTAAGTPISHSFIGLLRSGRKDNIDLKRLRGLAAFFGVPASYFTADQLADEVDAELELISALQELRARRVGLRDSVLSEADDATHALADVMRRIADLERKTGGKAPSGG